MEFALVVPILIFLLFGIIDYGLYFTNSLSVRAGVSDAARQISVGNFSTYWRIFRERDGCRPHLQGQGLCQPRRRRASEGDISVDYPEFLYGRRECHGSAGSLQMPSGGM